MSGSDGLRGVVALVTGAGQGIGRATALRLAAEGATVAGDDLYGGTYRLFDKVLAHTGGLEFTYADTTDPDAVEKALRPETKLLWIETPTNPLLTLSDIALLSEMVASVEEAVGLLVANAAYMSMGPFLEQDTQDGWHQIDTNLSGTFYLVRAVVLDMRRLGGGRIVIVSSEWGVTGWPNASAYAASKAGLISLG